MNRTLFADTQIRSYDLLDETTGTVAWIGTDVTVEVPIALLDDMAQIAHMSGQYARQGIEPRTLGLDVTTFGIEFTHPMFGSTAPGHVHTTPADVTALTSLWAGVHEALGAEFKPQIAALLDADEPMRRLVNTLPPLAALLDADMLARA